VGGKSCHLVNHIGLIVSWACDTANVYVGSAFQHLVDEVADHMVVFSDTAVEKVDWHPTNLRLCQRGERNVRMLVETVLSMLTYICNFKYSRHKVWDYFETKIGFAVAFFISWFSGTAFSLMRPASSLSRLLSSVSSSTSTKGY